jgi:hypothetical protein
MNAFPDFMKSAANRIMRSNQATPGVEGYVFDGIDGSQMAIWTCSRDGVSAEHVHDFDEYMLVAQGATSSLSTGNESRSMQARSTSFHEAGYTELKWLRERERSVHSAATAQIVNGRLIRTKPYWRKLI